MNSSPTIQDVLDAVRLFSTHVDDQFKEIRGDITSMRSDTTNMKGSMVTKTYLDEKLSDLRGDLVVMMRKEDRKLGTLVDILVHKRIIDQTEAKRILSLEPFAQT